MKLPISLIYQNETESSFEKKQTLFYFFYVIYGTGKINTTNK